MKKRIFLILGLTMLTALPAQAGCFADYKAKQDSPLRLHYGVIELPDAACASRAAAKQEIERRISRDRWKLLNVMSVFAQDGLAERKDSAGQFFLKY